MGCIESCKNDLPTCKNDTTGPVTDSTAFLLMCARLLKMIVGPRNARFLYNTAFYGTDVTTSFIVEYVHAGGLVSIRQFYECKFS